LETLYSGGTGPPPPIASSADFAPESPPARLGYPPPFRPDGK